MTPTFTTQAELRMRRAVRTNGVGKPCTNHLNLTVTLEQAWARAERLKVPAYLPPQRPPYAGYDPTERL